MEPISPRTQAPVIGEWRLISFEMQTGNEVIYPFGKHVQGTIMYTASGRFFGQVMPGGRPAFASDDLMKGTDEEMAGYRGCQAYYGSYELEGENVVIHHVEASLFPNWEGTSQRRLFEVSGNRLKIRTPPMQWDGSEVSSVILLFDRIV